MTNLGFNVYVKLNLIWEKSQNFGDFPKSNSINWNKKKFSFFNIKTLLFRNLPPSFSSLRSVVENTIEVRYLRGKAHRRISCNHLIVKKKHLSKTLLTCALNNLPLSHASRIISQKMTGNKALQNKSPSCECRESLLSSTSSMKTGTCNDYCCLIR